MKKIRLRKAKKKVIKTLERQSEELMAEMKAHAVSYYAEVVFYALKNVCEDKNLQSEFHEAIRDISVSNSRDTLKSMSAICELLETAELVDMSNLAIVVTGGEISVIRDFLVELLKASFFRSIEEDDLFGDDDILEETEDNDVFQDGAAETDDSDDISDAFDADKEELEKALFGVSECKGNCKFGMKIKDLRICKRCKHFLSEEETSPCGSCMGSLMGDCDVCEKNKEVTKCE